MIQIGQRYIEPSTLMNQQQWSGVQQEIISRMAKSQGVYAYESLNQLRFELKLRNQIVEAAGALQNSGVSFASFDTSRCNPAFWDLTERGGFRIKAGVLPSEGVLDIYRNGRQYAFECATAMVIIYYRAVLQSIDLQSFNGLFANIILYDWQYDQDLGLTTNQEVEFLPGDVLYFKNPDFDPSTPEWQGENAVLMGHDTYYGHGIGITGAEEIINFLNNERRPGGSQPAFLLDQATRPDFTYLAQFSTDATLRVSYFQGIGKDRITAQIGSTYYQM